MVTPFLALAAATPPAERPNIVLIFSDDHARQAISAYGSRLIQTPNIDRIGNEGAIFDRFYTANPLCAPSRACLLTGKLSHLNGLRDNRDEFDGSQPTFPKMLQAAGYETAVIGKWHLKTDPTGFDHWEVLPGQGVYYNPEFLSPAGRKAEPGYTTDVITDKALSWLKQDRSKPFFLLVGHKAPHRNWVPSLSKLSLFVDTVFPEPPTLRTDYDTLCSAAKTVQMRIDRHMRTGSDLMVDYVPPRLTEAEQETWKAALAPQDARYKEEVATGGDLLGTNYQRYLKSYLRCISSVDDGVGQVLDYLDRSGKARNTVVIYASDQGFFLGENAWYDKRWFYEPSAGTPLLVRDPRTAKPGSRIERVVSNLDLAPTVLDLAGVSVPADMQGESLAGLLRGETLRTPAVPAYGHFYESDDADHQAPKYVAVCTARHKAIYYYDLDEWELFDLARDPNETRNLWNDSAAARVRGEMVRKLLNRMRELKEEPALIAKVQSASHRRTASVPALR